MITDYHVHLETGPYTMEWLEEYYKVAKKRGITDLGFSEHAYRFKQSKEMLLNPWIEQRQTEDIDSYINLVLEAKRQGYPVKLGIELDFIPGKEKEIEGFIENYPWDYVIGSIHWIGDWGFDLEEMKNAWSGKEIIDVYMEYFNIIKQLLAFNKFDILGHIDVIKVLGHRPQKEYMESLLELYDDIISTINKSEIVVEMSTAGLRKPVGELYPSKELMDRLSTYKTPMIINSDAHKPEHVGQDYNRGLAYMKKYGIKNIATFNKRKRIMVPLG